MTESTRCGCGSNLDLRDVPIDSATGPCITVTVCGPCRAGTVGPGAIPEAVGRILARGAGVRLPGDPPFLRPS